MAKSTLTHTHERKHTEKKSNSILLFQQKKANKSSLIRREKRISVRRISYLECLSEFPAGEVDDELTPPVFVFTAKVETDSFVACSLRLA